MNKTKFSHVMNDDTIGITFLYFKGGIIQELNNEHKEIELDEFCIHMDEQEGPKLVQSINQEPQNLTVFNQEEMEIIKEAIEAFNDQSQGQVLHPTYGQPDSMTKEEWQNFLRKLQ